jgi:hypothetical protein
MSFLVTLCKIESLDMKILFTINYGFILLLFLIVGRSDNKALSYSYEKTTFEFQIEFYILALAFIMNCTVWTF